MLLRLLTSAGADPNHRHHVVSLTSLGPVGVHLKAHGISVETLRMRSGLGLPLLFIRLIRAIRRQHPDVVQTWMYHADLLGGLAARLCGIKSVVWGVRTTDVGQGNARATAFIQRACALISRSVPAAIVYVANSARAAHELIGYAPEKAVVIPNGYPLAKPPASQREVRTRLNIPDGAVVIGSVGRLNDAKDHRTFVKAAAIVAEARPDCIFLMLGRGVEWSSHALAEWIAETGRQDQFKLLGEVADVGSHLAAMDIFCLHSVSEAFPNVVAEAMNMALPCAVTDVGDAALLVANTGRIAPPANPDALACAIRELIDLDHAGREHLGQLAQERISLHFSIGAARRRYAALYERLLGRTTLPQAAPGRNERSQSGRNTSEPAEF